MTQGMISIITPCYNSETTIRQTIESVIAQSYTNWEMLIVDDASEDDSANIIKSYQINDSRIKYFKTQSPSGSPSKPRNIAIDNALGEYIAFLDSDDIWLPNKLEEQLRFLQANEANFIYSNYEKIDYKGKRNNRIIKMPPKTTFWDILETCSIPCLTVLLKHNIISDTRFRNIPKEDYTFWIEILKKGEVAYNTGEIHALYREQQNSRSSNKLKMIKNQWFVLREVVGVKKIIGFYFMIKYLFYGFYKYLK